MTRAADLEIGIHRRDSQTYAVEIRLLPPGADEEVRPDSGSMELDLDALRGETVDVKYGELLGGALLKDDKVREAFANARAVADAADADLRIRLLVGPTATELHTLRWEAARDPEKKNTLFTGEKLLFSRYVSSSDWRPLRPQGCLARVRVHREPERCRQVQPRAGARRGRDGGINATFGSAVETLAEGRRADAERAARDAARGLRRALSRGARQADQMRAEDLSREGGRQLGRRCRNGPGRAAVGAARAPPPHRARIVPERRHGGPADRRRVHDGARPAPGGIGIPPSWPCRARCRWTPKPCSWPRSSRSSAATAPSISAMSVARTETFIANRPDWWMPVLFMRLKSGASGIDRDSPARARTISTSGRRSAPRSAKGSSFPSSVRNSGRMFEDRANFADQLAKEHAFPLAAYERKRPPPKSRSTSARPEPHVRAGGRGEGFRRLIHERLRARTRTGRDAVRITPIGRRALPRQSGSSLTES